MLGHEPEVSSGCGLIASSEADAWLRCAHRGYLLTQVAGGVWADKFGGKKILGFGVVWWSLATMATPFAASMGLPVLLAARACMGIGEGVAMPAMNNLLSRCPTLAPWGSLCCKLCHPVFRATNGPLRRHPPYRCRSAWKA